jgi:signal transduction histidine kinase
MTAPIEHDRMPLDAEQLMALLDCVPHPVLAIDADGVLLYGNSSSRELEAWIKRDGPARNLLAELSVLTGSAKSSGPTPMAVLQSASEVRMYQVTSRPLAAPGGHGATALILSLAADKDPLHSLEDAEIARARLEDVQQQLLQADRMSSIGQLAAGVAHEINNPIGYIQSNLGTLSEYVSSLFRLLSAQDSALRHASGAIPEHQQIEEIRQQIDFDFLAKDLPMLLAESQEGITRVRKIVQDLREFSRAGHSEAWVVTDIHAGLESTINIVWNDLKYKVELVKRYGEVPLVECLPSQLNQVFMNILVNAGHAIEERGQITIATSAAGEQVFVEISDTGKGIAREHLEHIFEPFFTTKPIGKGTGLGLSISYGIVKKHGGEIDVRSEVGVGTTFLIKLPLRQSHIEGVKA